LFGGAIGDTGRFTITGESYIIDLMNKKWKKLNPSGQAPCNRAAH
jgi:protein phosphatase